MVVYKPKHTCCSSSENMTNTNTVTLDNNEINCHCPCPCPKPQEATITISVDDAPAVLETDVIYGPPGKNGTINGYNEVEVVGGNNIEVETSERNCHGRRHGIITINSTTSEHEIDAEPCNSQESSCNCEDCDCCNVFEQAKPCSCWYIRHNLNKHPSVTVVNEYGKEIICEVQYVSKNEIKLRFNGRFRGMAYLN